MNIVFNTAKNSSVILCFLLVPRADTSRRPAHAGRIKKGSAKGGPGKEDEDPAEETIEADEPSRITK